MTINDVILEGMTPEECMELRRLILLCFPNANVTPLFYTGKSFRVCVREGRIDRISHSRPEFYRSFPPPHGNKFMTYSDFVNIFVREGKIQNENSCLD